MGVDKKGVLGGELMDLGLFGGEGGRFGGWWHLMGGLGSPLKLGRGLGGSVWSLGVDKRGVLGGDRQIQALGFS